ncbi:MAG: hypothetical protein R3269_11660 [Oceanihabitans sediminis]|nr:hypothetical protein [Oceanihabitans sediminis]
MYSSDGGGGLMPCIYLPEEATQEELKACEDAHKEWYKSDDYKQYQEECYENNI